MAMSYKTLDGIANEIRREFAKDGVEVDSHTVDARLGLGKLKLNFGGFFENLEVLRDFIIKQWGMKAMSVEEIDGSIATVVTLGSQAGEHPDVNCLNNARKIANVITQPTSSADENQEGLRNRRSETARSVTPDLDADAKSETVSRDDITRDNITNRCTVGTVSVFTLFAVVSLMMLMFFVAVFVIKN
jgi:hypothetical protein